MDHSIEVLNQRIVFNDRFKVKKAHLRFRRFDGRMSRPIERLVFERGDAAAAIIVDIERQMALLTEQFRFPTYGKGTGWLQEVVAGMIDEGEEPEETIRREIQEEVGYHVQQLVPIGNFFVSPGGSSERIFLFYAEVKASDRTSAGGGLASENEDIRLVEHPLSALGQLQSAGELTDAKTLIAVQWLQLHLRDGKVTL